MTEIRTTLRRCFGRWQTLPAEVQTLSNLLGGQRYFVSRTYANRPVSIRFDPADQQLVFFEPNQPDQSINK